jgi:hypothetical protein
VKRATRRNSYGPSACRTPLPDSDSEFRHRLCVTYAGCQTCYATLSLDPRPDDGRARQRVEGVRFEGRARGGQHDDDRLVQHAPMLGRDDRRASSFSRAEGQFDATVDIVMAGGISALVGRSEDP